VLLKTSFLLVFLNLSGGFAFFQETHGFGLSIPWKGAKLQIQFAGELKADKGREYFVGPFGVSLGPDDRIYVADDLAHHILVFDKTKGLVESIGQKSNRPGDFAWVDAVAIDRAGNLYVADTGNDHIQILDTAHHVTKSVGKRGEDPGFFKNPRGIALDKNNRIYVADWGITAFKFLTRTEIS
jgi:DNA-binding beta-propeller fold protein YncE